MGPPHAQAQATAGGQEAYVSSGLGRAGDGARGMMRGE